MRAEDALALAKSYTKQTLEGSGAIQGQDGFSPVVTENSGNTDDIYKLDITTKTGSITTPNLKGEDGAQGNDGMDGVSPTIEENTNTNDEYTLNITDKNGTRTTPNLKGRQGIQGIQGIRGEKGDTGEQGLQGEAGEDGKSLVITENAGNSDTVYKLDIEDITGTRTTPNLIGRQGIQGIQGEKGLQGEQGEKGADGATGADGISPIITVNADNTEDVYKLDIEDKNGSFTTPNLVGRQGVQGIQGEPGIQGEQGIQGIQGIQGEKGDDGYPFLIYKEYTDISEFSAADFPEVGLMFMVKAVDADSFPVYRYTGQADTPYSYVTDLSTAEGLKGEKGDKGDTGEQGVQGEKGLDGITYTPQIGTITTVDSESDATASVAVDADNKTATFSFSIPRGVQGLQGLQGNDGEKGDPGEKGADGTNGTTYVPSIGEVLTVDSFSDASASVDIDADTNRAVFNFSLPQGLQGAQGLKGDTGDPGVQGEAGKDGTTYSPVIGTVNTVESMVEAAATVELEEDLKQAKFNFSIPKGLGIEKIEFTSSTGGDVAGIAGATDTYTITYTDGTTGTYEVYNGADGAVIDDTTTSAEKVWSSEQTAKVIGEHALPLLFDSGVIINTATKYYKIANGINPPFTISAGAYNFNYLLSSRNGEEIEIFVGKNDASFTVGAVRNFTVSGKIQALRRDGNDLYVALATYANFFRIYHKSGVAPDGFAVEEVTSIPTTATVIPIGGQTTADVASATIAYNTATAVATTDGEASTYSVRNGACYVSMDFTAQTTTDATVKLADAPRPSQTINSPAAMFDGSGADAIVKVYAAGLHVAKITSGKRYICSFSYPVA